MNLILFQPDEVCAPLPRSDVRARHILEVLRRQIGDTVDVGLIDGPHGKALVAAVSEAVLTLAFSWGAEPPPADPLTLIIGLPRPQTARKILGEATTLGVAAIHFVTTERGEASYAQSTLWSSGEWRRHLVAGAEQAFCTRVPQVTWGRPLAVVLAEVAEGTERVALDNYEATASLAQWARGGLAPDRACALALGPERGWTQTERGCLRAAGFTLLHLGPRVLRLETATVAALTAVKIAR